MTTPGLKRIVPMLLCTALSFGSLCAAEWNSDKIKINAPYMQVGFGQARRNASIEGRPIKIGGVPYTTNSLGLHADAEFSLKLDGKAVKVSGAVGIDDDTEGRGSVNFQWFDDSGAEPKLLWQSGEMNAREKAKPFSIDLKGVKQLRFNAAQGNDMDYDHADLVNFKLEYSGAEPVQQSLATAVAADNLVWDIFGSIGSSLNQGVFGVPGRRGSSAVAAWPRLPSSLMDPSLFIIQEDGSHNLELRLAKKSVKAIDNERTETTFVMQDPVYPVTVTLSATAYKTANVITSQVNVRNTGRKSITLLNRDGAFLCLPSGNDNYLTSFYGNWGREMTEIHEDKIGRGVTKHVNNSISRVAVPDYPGCYISFDGKLQEDKGRVFAAAIAWSGSWEYKVTVTENNEMFFSAGVPPSPSILKPGESYTSPKIVMTYTEQGAGQASRNFHTYGRMYGVYNGQGKRPVVLNSWEGVYMSFDEAKLARYIASAAGLGAEYFVLDDGWFGNKHPRNDDQRGLGDWQVNKAKLPHGIEFLCDECEKNNIKFGIWVEPEMVCPRSELFELHPDYATELKGRDVQLVRNQRVLDLTNPEVEAFVYNSVADLLKKHPRIAYIKWDHNCPAGMNPGSPVNPDNPGAFSDKFTEAYYRIMAKLRKNFPNVMFQACSSGGMRGDLGALELSDEFWGSDETNGIDRISIQWGWSHFFPSKAVASHIGRYKEGDYKFRTDVAMTARLGVELDPDAKEARQTGDPAVIKKGIAVYKSIRPLLHSADLYRGRDPHASQVTELTFAAQDKNQAVFFGFKRNRGARTESLKVSGLDASARYRLTELNADTDPRIESGVILSGAQLMKDGISVRFPDKVSSVVIKLDKVK